MEGPDWGDRPLLLAVDRDHRALGRIESELQRSFGADYRVRGELLAADAVQTLRGANERHERVAVVLVDDTFSDEERAQVFATARSLHPDARRALLVPWGAWAHDESARSILRSMAVGDISYYVLKPWTVRDELFHRTVAEFVHEWGPQRAGQPARGRGGGRSAFPPCLCDQRPARSQRHPARLS
jgi:thioredoxin reductase (NADPH)